MYKHIQAIERSIVPIIFYNFNAFTVFFEGKIYKHPEGTDLEHAFILWCYILRSKCESKAFNMDFTPLIEKILDQIVEVDNSREISGMYELEDD